METSMENAGSEKSAITLTTIIYALYAASFLVGVTAIVAIVMNYVKKKDVLTANGIWIIYRIVKGWLRLNDNRPMYVA